MNATCNILNFLSDNDYDLLEMLEIKHFEAISKKLEVVFVCLVS